jgi:hypothetical protein
MNCPGQSTSDLFYFSLYNQPDYLNTVQQRTRTAARGYHPAAVQLPVQVL